MSKQVERISSNASFFESTLTFEFWEVPLPLLILAELREAWEWAENERDFVEKKQRRARETRLQHITQHNKYAA